MPDHADCSVCRVPRLSQDKVRRLERNVKALMRTMTRIAVEQTHEMWKYIGKHQSWFNGTVNHHNLVQSVFCCVAHEDEPMTKWKDPRKGISPEGFISTRRRPRMDEREWTECMEWLEEEGLHLEWLNGGEMEQGQPQGTDDFVHWSCCGVIRKGQMPREKYCAICDMEYMGSTSKHKETGKHIDLVREVQESTRKRSLQKGRVSRMKKRKVVQEQKKRKRDEDVIVCGLCGIQLRRGDLLEHMETTEHQEKALEVLEERTEGMKRRRVG